MQCACLIEHDIPIFVNIMQTLNVYYANTLSEQIVTKLFLVNTFLRHITQKFYEIILVNIYKFVNILRIFMNSLRNNK